jgi:hypothetical protein
MLDQHNKGQERLRGLAQFFEQLEERVNLLEQAVIDKKAEGGGITIFDEIRDRFTAIESQRMMDNLKVTD